MIDIRFIASHNLSVYFYWKKRKGYQKSRNTNNNSLNGHGSLLSQPPMTQKQCLIYCIQKENKRKQKTPQTDLYSAKNPPLSSSLEKTQCHYTQSDLHHPIPSFVLKKKISKKITSFHFPYCLKKTHFIEYSAIAAYTLIPRGTGALIKSTSSDLLAMMP